MPLDDGLAPLLPQQRRPEIKLPGRKLALLGVCLGCSIVIDGVLCAYFCTGGFSSAWWRRLGMIQQRERTLFPCTYSGKYLES